MWCDMDSIQLVKQILQLLYGNCGHYNSPIKSKAKSAVKSETTLHNRKMLDTINNIRKKQKVCSTLLGAFMEAQVRVSTCEIYTVI